MFRRVVLIIVVDQRRGKCRRICRDREPLMARVAACVPRKSDHIPFLVACDEEQREYVPPVHVEALDSWLDW